MQNYRGRGSGAAKGAKRAGKADLSEEQKQEIREAFDLFDTDGSGKFHRAPMSTLEELVEISLSKES